MESTLDIAKACKSYLIRIHIISCNHIFRFPKMETTTTTVHRGITYDVTVNGMIPLSSLSLETVFSCSMEIPGTQFSLKKDTMYMHTNIRMRDRQVAGGSRWCGQGVGAVMATLGFVILGLKAGCMTQ